MSDRSSIKTELVKQMNLQMNAANEGSLYYNDMDQAVLGDNIFLDSIETFPTITVGLGPERYEYHPAGFNWVYLTLYFRGYVKSEDETEERLEQLIADIKTFVDNFDSLDYTVTKPDGTTENKAVAQMTTISTTTDEGILKPLGLAEISLEVRYVNRNVRT